MPAVALTSPAGGGPAGSSLPTSGRLKPNHGRGPVLVHTLHRRDALGQRQAGAAAVGVTADGWLEPIDLATGRTGERFGPVDSVV